MYVDLLLDKENCGKSRLGHWASRPPGSWAAGPPGRGAVAGRGPRGAGPSTRQAVGLLLAKPIFLYLNKVIVSFVFTLFCIPQYFAMKNLALSLFARAPRAPPLDPPLQW